MYVYIYDIAHGRDKVYDFKKIQKTWHKKFHN